MVIFETPIFTKLIQDVMEDDDYAALQQALFINPVAGDLNVYPKNIQVDLTESQKKLLKHLVQEELANE